MRIDSFIDVLTERTNTPDKKWLLRTYVEQVANDINVMTGGAFYESVEKLPEDWEFPT